MKKLIMILLVLSAMAITTNAQIPNSGLETWGNFSSGGSIPYVFLKPNHWSGSDDYSFFSIRRNPDNFPLGTGQYSMIITSDPSNNVMGVALSYDSLPQTLSPTNIPPAFPVNFRPTSFCLYYKYISVGGDSMTASCFFYKNGSKIGGAGYISGQNVSNWSSLIIPVTFSTADIPDSATIIFTTFDNTQHDSSTLYVDNLSFDNLITTSVSFNPNERPGIYSLSQNYPNPFNPSTAIQFTVPSSGRAVLKVFNVLGQEVAALFDGEAAAGVRHEVQFNASNLPSGIYFSRLDFDGKMQVRKMLLLK
jgi:Secretion system C-terminal sorting domain